MPKIFFWFAKIQEKFIQIKFHISSFTYVHACISHALHVTSCGDASNASQNLRDSLSKRILFQQKSNSPKRDLIYELHLTIYCTVNSPYNSSITFRRNNRNPVVVDGVISIAAGWMSKGCFRKFHKTFPTDRRREMLSKKRKASCTWRLRFSFKLNHRFHFNRMEFQHEITWVCSSNHSLPMVRTPPEWTSSSTFIFHFDYFLFSSISLANLSVRR